MNNATVPLAKACGLIGCTRQWAYGAIQEGKFPVTTISIGRKVVVPRAKLRDLLGLTDDELDAAMEAQPGREVAGP